MPDFNGDNKNLSHLMSVILNEVWKDATSVSLNTEEMLAAFRKLNDKLITEEIIVGSADVKALYPRLDIEFTVEEVCEMFYNSEVKVEVIDVGELGLYLALKQKVRQMFTEAMKIALLFIMENRVYNFDNEMKLQSKGGPIGLKLTGILA